VVADFVDGVGMCVYLCRVPLVLQEAGEEAEGEEDGDVRQGQGDPEGKLELGKLYGGLEVVVQPKQEQEP
jgi:hypothetical protein